MKKSVLVAPLLFALAMLGGCAGTDFVRPGEGALVNGKTTQADVLAKMGNPRQTGDLTKNDKQLKVFRYAYAVTGGEARYPGVIPARGLTLTFFNDRLASHEFVSSFREDSSEFDGAKVSSIVKGKSTRADVIALLGKPAGEAIYPVIKGEKDNALVYSYAHAKGSVFDMKFFRRTLLISFNPGGVVTDVEYTTDGTL